MSDTVFLCSESETEYTQVSNLFIEHYMPRANGAYVKVYLYLLRLLQSARVEGTLAMVADALDETEKDVERALKYWEKQKLLRLERNGGAITGIVFLKPRGEKQSEESTEQAYPADVPAPQAEGLPEILLQVNAAAADAAPPASGMRNGKAGREAAKRSLPERPDYSEAQIEVLTSLDEVRQMLLQVQQVTGRLLKGADLNFVLYLYEGVGFPADLIIYLYEYCASRGKTSISYIESVAIAWAENDVDTVEKAKMRTAAYSSSYSAVNRAFGLNRAPGNVEIQYIHRWTGEYGFDADILEEACNRTILAVSKPDFKYADKILERWHSAGVRTREDIAPLDAEFAKQNQQKEMDRQAREAARGSSASNNRFNAFPQRKYSASDYSAMEKQLLGSR